MEQTRAAERLPADDGPQAGTPARPTRVERATGRLRAASVRRWFWSAVLAAGYLFQLAFRLSMVVHRTFPSVHADEDSYLVLARVLAGRPTTEMPVGVVIPGGYPLLISPALRLADNPVTAYHLVMGINALLNSLLLLLVFAALRRAGLPRGYAVLFAMVTTALPPVVFYSQFVLTETIFPLLLLSWLLCMHGWLTEGPLRGRYLYGVGMGASAAYAMATHDRGGVICALTGLVLLLTLVFGWAPRWTSVAAGATLLAGMGGARLLASYLESKFDTTPPSEVGNLVFETLFDLEKLSRTLTRVAGQIWYFTTSTYGVGAIALAFCLAAVFISRIDRATRLVSLVMVAALVGIALASAAGLGDQPRVDNWIYARYLSSLVPAYFVIGVALLYRAGSRLLLRLTAGGLLLTVALGATVVEYAGRELKGWILPWGVPDALFLGFNWGSLHIWRTTEVAVLIVGMCVLFRTTGGRKVLWVLGLGLGALALFATTTITAEVAKPHHDSRKYAATGFTKAAGTKRTDNLVMDWDNDWSMRMAQTYEIYWGRVWTTNLKAGNTPPPEATVALLRLPSPPESPDGTAGSPTDSTAAVKPEDSWKLAPAGWHVDKVSRKDGWVLWRRG